jgi:hypothetical protein
MVTAWRVDTKDTLPADTIDIFYSSALTDQPRSGYHLMETREGLNPDLSVEMEDTRLGRRVDIHG